MKNNLIIFGKWVLNKFSTRVEENTFDIRKYIFHMSLTEADLEEERASDQVIEDRQRELRQSSKNRKDNLIHFKLKYRTDEIVKTSRDNLTQIIMDIDRPLTSDAYKIIYLVYANTENYVDLKIGNINYAKPINHDEPK